MGQSQFAATRWTMVLAAARGGGDSGGRRALAELAGLYWFPLYAYVRRQGYGPEEAEDLTQAFFARLLEKQALRGVEQGKGKFRSFLLASVQHFLLNEWDRERALKRGGGVRVLALDGMAAEARYAVEPVEDLTAERVFERRWAWAVLDHVLARLREQYERNGQGAVFEVLKGMLTGAERESYGEMAVRLGMTEGTLMVVGHRLRRRYRALLREEIAETVEEGAIEEEIRYLLKCL